MYEKMFDVKNGWLIKKVDIVALCTYCKLLCTLESATTRF